MAKKPPAIVQAYIDWYVQEFGFAPPGANTAEKAGAAEKMSYDPAHRQSWAAYRVDHQIFPNANPKTVKQAHDEHQAAAQRVADKQLAATPPVPPAASVKKAAAAASTLDPFGGQDASTTFGVVSSYANFVPNSADPDAIQHRVAGPAYEDANNYARDHLTNLDQTQLQVLQKQLSDAGYLQSGHITGLLDQETFAAYSNLLKDTSLANTAGNIITPDDYLKAKQQKSSKSGTHTATSRSVTVASPDDAKSLALQTFRQALGRAPRPGELSAFMGALDTYERAHAQITTRTSTTDAQGNETAASSTTTGGSNDQQFATDYVAGHDGQEQQAYAAGTAYFQAALDVLKAGGGGFSGDSISQTHS